MSKTIAAIILGASEWPRSQSRWQGSQVFRNSAHDFKRYLADPDGLALSDEVVLDLFDDPRAADDLDEEINQFLIRLRSGDRLKDVILYFTGHGAFAEDRRYCLATRAARADALGQSGYRVASLARTINRNVRDGRKFVILDACFAGAAQAAFIAQSDVATHLEEQTMSALAEAGTALLCATSSTDVALAPRAGFHTMFSGALIQALKTGSASAPPFLSFDDLRTLIADLIEKQYKDEAVVPEIHVPDQRRGDVSRVALFPNPRHQPPGPVPPPVEAGVPVEGEFRQEPPRTAEAPAEPMLSSSVLDKQDPQPLHADTADTTASGQRLAGRGHLNRRTVLWLTAAGAPALASLLFLIPRWRGTGEEKSIQIEVPKPPASGVVSPPPPQGASNSASSNVAMAPSAPIEAPLPPPGSARRAAECASILARQSLDDSDPNLRRRAKALRCR